MLSRWLSVYLSVRLSCLITKLRVAVFGENHVMHRIQLLFSTIALFMRIELLCSSIRRLPPSRANGVAVFGSSLIRNNNSLIERQKSDATTALDKKG